LVPENNSVLVGEELKVQLNINSGLVKLNMVNAQVQFDPDILELSSIDNSGSFFSDIDQNLTDNENGVAILKQRFQSEDDLVNARDDEKIATLIFKAKAYIGKTDLVVLDPIDNPSEGEKDGSWAYGKEGKTNILTKVSGADFRLLKNTSDRSITEINSIKEKVVLDSSFTEWGEATQYVGFSNVEQGYLLGCIDILEGHCLSDEDASINFFLGRKDDNLFLGAFINDESLTDKDYIEVTFNGEVQRKIYLKQDDLLNLSESIIELARGTYVMEARFDIKKDFKPEDFNILYYDTDDDGTQSSHAFSY
jgi:hypothetical protein